VIFVTQSTSIILIRELNIKLNIDTKLPESSRQVVDVKISEIRKLMTAQSIDAWIIPTSDPHNCETPPDRWLGRSWLSGFTGSAGTLVILKNKAALWTDGRYHLQAEQQLSGTCISLVKQGLPDVPEVPEWLDSNLSTESTIGFDGKSMPYSTFESIQENFLNKGVTFKTDIDLLDNVWHDRPQAPTNAIFEHEDKFHGKSRTKKLTEVRKMMSKVGADWFALSALDDIAWLFNIRGADIKNCSTTLSYALISKDHTWLCNDNSKTPKELVHKLNDENIIIVHYSAIFELTANIPATSSIYFDKNITSAFLYNCMNSNCKKVSGTNFTTTLKAIKNKTEIENYKKCLTRDGVYMVQFMKWLEDNIGKQKITELSAAKYLNSLRAQDENFHDLSFPTIAGFGENGALMHYLPSPKTDTEVSEHNFFLVDSGGLYKDGTTDITRTFSFGKLSERQIHDYTLVTKAHINMARTVFIQGCRGTQIDYAARAEMWREGINYNCATGHGVGFFLNVHEGPHNIGQRFVDEELKPGMIVTNEPGIYRSKHHGIRLENVMLCYEKETTEFGTFNAFETLSPCPIDTRAIDNSQLNKQEIDWLNSYHQMVYDKISPLLDDEHRCFLKEKTAPLQY
jgi:Xaa-Pro aminopeptidase